MNSCESSFKNLQALWAGIISICLLLHGGCSKTKPTEPEKKAEPKKEDSDENPLHVPPPPTDEARYDMPDNPGSSLQEPAAHCLVFAGYDRDGVKIFASDPADNLKTGHKLQAELTSHPVRFIRNFLTTKFNKTPATVYGAVIIQPPDRREGVSLNKWMQTGMPDLSQHASSSWKSFCAPTSAANTMLFFAKRYGKLHPKHVFPGQVGGNGDNNPFINRLIAGFTMPMPKPNSIAALMNTTRNGSSGEGIIDGSRSYLRHALGEAEAGKWQVKALEENMDDPDGPGLYNKLCNHCAAGDGVLLLILWGIPVPSSSEKADNPTEQEKGNSSLTEADNQNGQNDAGRFLKEVDNAKGKKGPLQIILTWETQDDLDLHCTDPNGEEINWEEKFSSTGGHLNLESNSSPQSMRAKPVENIYWEKGRIPAGTYKIEVRCPRSRTKKNVNYRLAILRKGEKPIIKAGRAGPGIPATTFEIKLTTRQAKRANSP